MCFTGEICTEVVNTQSEKYTKVVVRKIMASTVSWQVKLLLATLAHHFGVMVQVPNTPLQIQLPASALGKPAQEGSRG